MFVAIVGTRSAGKDTVKEYLVKDKGFTYVGFLQHRNNAQVSACGSLLETETDEDQTTSLQSRSSRGYKTHSFLMMNTPLSTTFPHNFLTSDSLLHSVPEQEMIFDTHTQLLDYVTRNWKDNFVTTQFTTPTVLEAFRTRPFFMVVSIDAPIMTRYARTLGLGGQFDHLTLEDFVQEHDSHFYGQQVGYSPTRGSSLGSLRALVDVHITNAFESKEDLYDHLEELDLTNGERLRPGWDTYFMRLADLASLRSNCMKRRVGAILVRHKRILATGYNGTPRGLTNCNEGGCHRCNDASEASDECVCLHAEENALLEAGRERVGDESILYCNTCPCLKCTIKIIQTGVKEVVYNLSYKVDDASAALFLEAGVLLRRHAPPLES